MRQLEKTLNTATYIVKVQNNCAWTQRRKRWGRDACVKKKIKYGDCKSFYNVKCISARKPPRKLKHNLFTAQFQNLQNIPRQANGDSN